MVELAVVASDRKGYRLEDEKAEGDRKAKVEQKKLKFFFKPRERYK